MKNIINLKDERIFLSKNKMENTRQIYNSNNNPIPIKSVNNFPKKNINNDIMDKITNILNDKDKQENYESCYLGSGNKIIRSLTNVPIALPLALQSPNSAGKFISLNYIYNYLSKSLSYCLFI
jgi:hypothetical protein